MVWQIWGGNILKDKRNGELARHLWLVYVRHEEAPLGNLGWMRRLVLRDISERDGPIGSGVGNWWLLVGGFIVEIGALD